MDEILNLIESVSKGFPSYSCLTITSVFITSFFSASKGYDSKNFSRIFSICNKAFYDLFERIYLRGK